MTASKILLYFCLSFISGIFLSSFFIFSLPVLLVFLILAIILISLFWKYKKLVIIGFSIFFLIFGIWRYQSSELEIKNNQLRKYNDLKETIILIGIVTTEPDVREKIQRLTVKINRFQKEESFIEIKEKVLIITQKYPQYQYGDKLKITGKLETPPIFEEFNYRDYLKKDRIYSVISWPKIELIETDLGNPILKFIFAFKNRLEESVESLISPPQVGILEALIFGNESEISKEWKEKLNITGTRHITAVSGMNITLITFLILNFFLILGFWRNQAFYFSIFLLIIYILMIGTPSSAVRAGIMGGILILAQYFGRLSTAFRAVIFAATLMLFINPLLLRYDIGFQLSFLAILGLIYLQPTFFEFLIKIPNPKFFPIRTTLSATLSAQIFTLPILVYNFGNIPLFSPITNILIVPLLTPITILIFIFSILAMISWWFGWIFSFPIWFVLSYIINIVDWFSKLPFASFSIQNLHWIFLLISYFILALISWYFYEKQKLKFLQY